MTAEQFKWYRIMGLCETSDIVYGLPYKFKTPYFIKQ